MSGSGRKSSIMNIMECMEKLFIDINSCNKAHAEALCKAYYNRPITNLDNYVNSFPTTDKQRLYLEYEKEKVAINSMLSCKPHLICGENFVNYENMLKINQDNNNLSEQQILQRFCDNKYIRSEDYDRVVAGYFAAHSFVQSNNEKKVSSEVIFGHTVHLNKLTSSNTVQQTEIDRLSKVVVELSSAIKTHDDRIMAMQTMLQHILAEVSSIKSSNHDSNFHHQNQQHEYTIPNEDQQAEHHTQEL